MCMGNSQSVPAVVTTIVNISCAAPALQNVPALLISLFRQTLFPDARDLLGQFQGSLL